MNTVITFLIQQLASIILGDGVFERVIATIERWADKEIANAEKRSGVLAEFEIIGLQLSESVANLALELGVQFLKRMKG